MNYRCYFLSNAKFNGSPKYSDISGIILHIHIEAETYADTLNYNLQLSWATKYECAITDIEVNEVG